MRRTGTSRGLTPTRRQMIGVAGALAATCLLSGTRVARAEGADEKLAGSPSDFEGALFAARARDDDGGNPNLWGFIDATGAWVIEPQFEDVASEPRPSYDVGAGVSPLETVYDARPGPAYLFPGAGSARFLPPRRRFSASSAPWEAAQRLGSRG